MRFSVRVVCVVIVAVLAAGCGMVGSSLLSMDEYEMPVCHSSAGSYYLPKAFLRVEVDQQINDPNDPSKNFNILKSISIARKPDSNFGFCLNYLSSPTADDDINVKKTPNHLLGYVSAHAIDQSAFIAKSIVRAISIGVSGNPNFRTAARGGKKAPLIKPALQLEYDPFDPVESVNANNALRQRGFCLILEAATFDLDSHTIERYCNRPHLHSERRQVYRDVLTKASETPEIKERKAIFYRPRMSYTLYLFKREKEGDPWHLGSSYLTHLENISPIVAVRLDRAFFSERKAHLQFVDGTLANVCIYKTSELEPFVEVPLEIVKSVVAIPAQIVSVRIDQTNGQANLFRAQQRLLRRQEQHLRVLRELEEDVQSADPTTSDVSKTEAPKPENGKSGDEFERQTSTFSEFKGEANLSIGAHTVSNPLNSQFDEACPSTAPELGTTPALVAAPSTNATSQIFE